MIDSLRYIFNPNNFEPHGEHFIATPALFWIFLLANLMIFLAYTVIPMALIYFVRKRTDLAFHWIFLWFGAFIVLCGLTHLLHVITLWYPIYGIASIVDILTAIVSWATFFSLLPVIPLALALPSPGQLKDSNDKLVNEVEMRKKAEEELRQKQNDLVAHQTVLSEKNSELERTNRMLVAREQKINELKREIQGIRGRL